MEPLMMFYGTECPHCHRMMPLVDRLEREAKISVARLEVWHDEKNYRVMENYDKDHCGGVPFFFNVKTGAWLCGEVPYEKLAAWAK